MTQLYLSPKCEVDFSKPWKCLNRMSIFLIIRVHTIFIYEFIHIPFILFFWIFLIFFMKTLIEEIKYPSARFQIWLDCCFQKSFQSSTVFFLLNSYSRAAGLVGINFWVFELKFNDVRGIGQSLPSRHFSLVRLWLWTGQKRQSIRVRCPYYKSFPEEIKKWIIITIIM